MICYVYFRWTIIFIFFSCSDLFMFFSVSNDLSVTYQCELIFLLLSLEVLIILCVMIFCLLSLW